MGIFDWILTKSKAVNIADDEVWRNVTKAEKPILLEYQCRKCKHIFSQLNDDQNYCPACDCEDIDELTNTHTQELKGGDK